MDGLTKLLVRSQAACPWGFLSDLAGPDANVPALVNEAFLRLVDAARARGSGKRGGGVVRLDLNESIDALPEPDSRLVDLDEALESLARFDGRKAKVVELRFFGGLSVEETPEVLKISQQSVMRDWELARAWLMRELSQ